MLIRLYIEALLLDEEAADAVWEAWDTGELSDQLAMWAWWQIGDFVAAVAWWIISTGAARKSVDVI